MIRLPRISLPTFRATPKLEQWDNDDLSSSRPHFEEDELSRPGSVAGDWDKVHKLRVRRRSSVTSIQSTASQSRSRLFRRCANTTRAKMLRERQDWLRKFSPLSSQQLLPVSSTEQLPNYHLFDPSSTEFYYWLGFVSLATIYYLWTAVLRMAFDSVHEGVSATLLWFLLDALSYAVFIGDVIVQSRTGYLHDGILEENQQLLKRRYMASSAFYLDILAVAPLDILYIFIYVSPAPPFLHGLKLLKVYRLKEFFERTESRTHFPHGCRVLFLIHNLLVIIHWNACIYFLISKYIGYGSDRWVYPAWNTTKRALWGDLSRQYIYCFYWSTLTLTTIGELPKPTANGEFIFVTVDYLIGILMFATLVGNVGGIIANMQKLKVKFQNKMDSVKVYMRQMNVPDPLQDRVIKWFDYLWTHGHPIDDHTVLDYLPDKLKAEIKIHVHFETLKKVDFFEDCEQSMLWELLLRLQLQVYSPKEYVCRKGDVGREMYIISHGKLEVLAEEDSNVLKELKPGDYFGEISVLNLGKSQRRRTAFVRSVGYSDLLCLSQIDLLEIMKDYPQALESLTAKGMKKLQAANTDGELSQEITPGETIYEEPSSNSDEWSSEEDEWSGREDERITPILGDTFTFSSELKDQIVEIHLKLSAVEKLLQEVVPQNRNCSSPELSLRNDSLSQHNIITANRKISCHV